MTQYRHVFSPFQVGNVPLKNRIEVAPMLSCMATPDGFVTREMIEFYQSFARGGAGIVTVGDSAIDYEYAKAHHYQLNLGDDRVIGGLSNLVEAIHQYGAKASIELDHSGRLVSPKVINGRNPIGPSAVTLPGEETSVTVQEMDQAMIDRVIEHFAGACYRCMTAGFEMVMLHGAHGQLLSQFVSPFSNKRTDKYGGSLANRARFVIEVLEAIRRKVGDRLVLEYRISGDELVPEGLHLEETIEFIKLIQDKIDLVHVSLGGVGDPKYIIHMAQPFFFPHGYNVHRAEKIKQAVRIPVTCVGSITDLAMADEIIREGRADIVAMGRAHIADPAIVNKTYRGQLEAIRPCLRCNVCGERPSNFLPPRCTVNPEAGREVEYRYLPPAARQKHIVIVGGGPAGMEAAQVAFGRGHRVTLYERELELGGTLRYAAGPDFKTDMKRYLEWMVQRTLRSPVEVKLATEATAAIIEAARPDALILAVGADPFVPDIPGIRNQNVVWAGEVDLDRVKTGDTVVVVGAGLTGCETALHLARQGKRVKVVDIIEEEEIARDVSMVSRIKMLELLEENGVVFRTGLELQEVNGSGIVVADRQRNKEEIAADTVVLAMGSRPRAETVQALAGLVPEVYVIGDCRQARNLMAAVHDGFHVAAEI